MKFLTCNNWYLNLVQVQLKQQVTFTFSLYHRILKTTRTFCDNIYIYTYIKHNEATILLTLYLLGFLTDVLSVFTACHFDTIM